VHTGKWPLRIDNDDIAHVYFQDPADNNWHALVWEHADSLDGPFSKEALAYARKLAAETERFPDDQRALAKLLERWDAGLTRNPTERRMAVRIAQHRSHLLAAAEAQPPSAQDDVRLLPSVQMLAIGDPPPPEVPANPEPTTAGDDDDERDLVAEPGIDRPNASSGEELSDEEFYAEAMRPTP
jgi:hypothetical protein